MSVSKKNKPRCGLCGASMLEALKEKNSSLTITDCCQKWICDDEHIHCDPSNKRNLPSCSRNHYRYTMCFNHYNEKHTGKFRRNCKQCRAEHPDEEDMDNPAENWYVYRPHTKKAVVTCEHCDLKANTMRVFGGWHWPTAVSHGTKFFCRKAACKRAMRIVDENNNNDNDEDDDDEEDEDDDEDDGDKENTVDTGRKYECAKCKITSATFDPFVRATHSQHKTLYFCKKQACIRASGIP